MKNKQSGFTMIEIMITLTIASILLSYGIPNLKELLIRQSITTKANSMLVDLSYARSAAINGGTPVSIVANTKWEDGWRIETDNNNDGIVEVLRVSNSIEEQIILSDDDVNTPIVFNPTGTLRSSNAREIKIKHNSIEQSKTLTIALSGNSSIR